MHINIYNGCRRYRRPGTVFGNKYIRTQSHLSLDSTAVLWGVLPKVIASLTLQQNVLGCVSGTKALMASDRGCRTSQSRQFAPSQSGKQPKSPSLKVNISWVSCQASHVWFYLTSVWEVAISSNIPNFIFPFGQFYFPIAETSVASIKNFILCYLTSCPLT